MPTDVLGAEFAPMWQAAENGLRLQVFGFLVFVVLAVVVFFSCVLLLVAVVVLVFVFVSIVFFAVVVSFVDVVHIHIL